DKGVRVSSETPGTYSDTFQTFRMSIHEGNIVEPQVSTGEPLRTECHHFIDCIRDNKQPETDGKNGLEVVQILEALTHSLLDHGKPVNLWKQ
ncbi:hypothetical protein BVY02_01845, partial [bacterium J17]